MSSLVRLQRDVQCKHGHLSSFRSVSYNNTPHHLISRWQCIITTTSLAFRQTLLDVRKLLLQVQRPLKRLWRHCVLRHVPDTTQVAHAYVTAVLWRSHSFPSSQERLPSALPCSRVTSASHRAATMTSLSTLSEVRTNVVTSCWNIRNEDDLMDLCGRGEKNNNDHFEQNQNWLFVCCSVDIFDIRCADSDLGAIEKVVVVSEGTDAWQVEEVWLESTKHSLSFTLECVSPPCWLDGEMSSSLELTPREWSPHVIPTSRAPRHILSSRLISRCFTGITYTMAVHTSDVAPSTVERLTVEIKGDLQTTTIQLPLHQDSQ